MKRKILVRGPALSQTGYGEQTRFALRALRRKENIFDIYVINTDWGKSNWIWADTEERKWIDSLISKATTLPRDNPGLDMSLQVTIPNEWERLSPYDVGYTAGVETTKVSENWIKKANEMQKIVFVSSFSEEIFNKTVYLEEKSKQYIKNNTPTQNVNYGIREIAPEKIEVDFAYDFNFLSVCQWGPRKNLDNLIKWFVEEFKDEEVGLVVKTNLVKNSIIDREMTQKRLKMLLEPYSDRKCKIHLVHGYLSDGQLQSLYQNPKIKAMLTTTHGEGFGLPLFEAAINELPVAAPDWSGHCDFLYAKPSNRKNSKVKGMFAKIDFDLKEVQDQNVWGDIIIKDSKWAYAKESSFKRIIRDIYKDYGRFKSQAKKLKKSIDENFKEEDKLEEFCQSIMPPDWIEPEQFDSISFCIATNASKVDKTKKVIEALQSQITTKKIEILICGVIEPFKELESDIVKLIDAAEVANTGHLAELRNISGAHCTGDVICWLDDDMLFPPGWLWQLETFSGHEGWDVIGNRVCNPDGTRFWDRSLQNPHVLVNYNHSCLDKRLYQTGGFWVVRKHVFEEHAWDGTLLIYADKNQGRPNEDIDYSNRLQSDGYLIKFDAENVIWHWDDGYTQLQVSANDGKQVFWQTLRKSDVESQVGPQSFPPRCDQFKNLLSMMGLDQDA